MANYRRGNVIFVDTTDSVFTDVRNVKAIKYIGETGGSANIKCADTGSILWQADGTSDIFEEVCIRNSSGIEVEVASSATVFVYVK